MSDIKILIVEDDKDVAEMNKLILENLGFAGDIAYDGQEAIDLLSDNKYPLVLLDIMLPKVNGLEVLKFLREKYNKNETSVIVLSALADNETIEKAMSLGADEYMEKAKYNLDFIEDTINKLLGNKK